MDAVRLAIKDWLDISIIAFWIILLLGAIGTLAYWYKQDQNKENFWLLVAAVVVGPLFLLSAMLRWGLVEIDTPYEPLLYLVPYTLCLIFVSIIFSRNK